MYIPQYFNEQCMAFGRLTHRGSLSDTIICLKAHAYKAYHLGIGEVVAKSTLSAADENRSCFIGMGSSVCICSRSHRKEEISAPAITLRNITDFKHLHFLKNAHKSTISVNSKTICQRTKL